MVRLLTLAGIGFVLCLSSFTEAKAQRIFPNLAARRLEAQTRALNAESARFNAQANRNLAAAQAAALSNAAFLPQFSSSVYYAPRRNDVIFFGNVPVSNVPAYSGYSRYSSGFRSLQQFNGVCH